MNRASTLIKSDTLNLQGQFSTSDERHEPQNDPKINAFMVHEGKKKIAELIKARNSGDDVI